MSKKDQPWQPTTIRRFIQAFATSACTTLVETDAGKGYLKALGGPEGPHTLACELVGSRLARWFGLPTFDCATISVTDADEIPFHNGGKAHVGPAFITRAESGEPWSGEGKQLDKLINPQDISRLIVFDTWTLNCDRHSWPADGKMGQPRINRNNVFLSEEAPEGQFLLKAIDHTHCFTCGRELSRSLRNIDKMKDPRVFGLFPEFRKFLERVQVHQAVADLHRVVRAEVVRIIQDVPKEWEVSEEALEALADLVVGRAGYVADNIENQLWPQKATEGTRLRQRGRNGAVVMKPTKGYYSLIQYCPDRGRLEAANVGVLVFRPAPPFFKALTSRNNSRIIRFFGSEGHDWLRINAFKKGLEDRIALEGAGIKSVEQLEQFIAQRANLLQITPPRPMKVLDPEKDLEELFKEFLGESVHRTSTRTLRRFVAERLNTPAIAKKVRRDIRVQIPVLQKEVEIPFGFQNGRFNLINPVRFESANSEQSVITACKYAVEGRSLYESPDPELGPLQLVVVGKFRPKDHESPARVRRVFEDHRVKLFRIVELPQLIEEIRTTGKDIDGAG